MTNTLSLRKIILLGGDIILLYLSLFLAVFSDFPQHFLPFSILYIFWLTVFYIFGLYDLKIIKSGLNFYTRIVGALAANFLLGVAFFYLIPLFGITPKTNLALSIVIFGALFFAWRKIFYSFFSSRFLTTVAIFKQDSRAEELAEEIKKRPYLGYKVAELEMNEDLLSQIRENKVDTIIIPGDPQSDEWLAKNLYRCLPARINFMDWTRAYELICEKIPVSFIPHSWFLKNLREGEKAIYDKAKRLSDVLISSLIVVLTLPLWPLIVLAVKLEDGGPIFYKQKRVGKDGKDFLLYKFRSMKKNAEDKTGAVWAEEKDPRTTRVGKFLRRTHLDELPQMINILKGDISLVGPRPERPEFVEQLSQEIPHYQIRHLIKPGFTGWAQIKFRYGRTVMDAKEKFEYDLYYLKNRSPLLDLGILLKTAQLFFKKN